MDVGQQGVGQSSRGELVGLLRLITLLVPAFKEILAVTTLVDKHLNGPVVSQLFGGATKFLLHLEVVHKEAMEFDDALALVLSWSREAEDVTAGKFGMSTSDQMVKGFKAISACNNFSVAWVIVRKNLVATEMLKKLVGPRFQHGGKEGGKMAVAISTK